MRVANVGAVNPLRLGGRWFLVGLLFAAVGCGPPKKVEHADVSGQVSYKGQPLPGGRITFVAAKGGFAGSANIDEEGKYKVSAPVGDVKIGVDNSMLRAQRGAPKNAPRLQRPGSEDPNLVKGHYVNLPDKYAKPDDSGLTFKVEKGAQTHDINLE